MELLVFQIIIIIDWLLFVFGFYDRIFFLIGAIIGFFFGAFAMNDGSFVVDSVYNLNTATWITRTIDVYPTILLMAVPVIASALIFMVVSLPNRDNDVMF